MAFIMATLTFFGAAGTVTGSSSLIETDGARFLVDCGLYQGNRSVRDLNLKPFPFDAAGVGFLILTHAHIDHSGLIPKLAKAGFSGPIYTTQPTADLLEFLLPDSASIQESNADRMNRKRRRRGQPEVEPVYGTEHAEQALELLQPVDYETLVRAGAGGAGAIVERRPHPGLGLGRGRARSTSRGNSTLRLLFSGDLGPDEKAFYADPEAPEGFDYIVCESTYGDRDREDYTLEGRRMTLRRELTEGLSRGGNVVIPSFAVERSQELLYDIGVLLARRRDPPATVYLDSPLARKVTGSSCATPRPSRTSTSTVGELFRDPHFRLVETVDESKAINEVKGGAIIISASGMCDAGPHQAPPAQQHLAPRGHRALRRLPGARAPWAT